MPSDNSQYFTLPENTLNIALLPVDPDINTLFFEIAQSQLGNNAGYCLRPADALPHVTLCHFQHGNPDEAVTMLKDYIGKTMQLRLERLYLSPLANSGEQVFWVGVSTSRDPALLSLQSQIAETLHKNDRRSLTPLAEQYHPHFTLMLLAPENFGNTNLLLRVLRKLVGSEIECVVRLGISDRMGQYQKAIGTALGSNNNYISNPR